MELQWDEEGTIIHTDEEGRTWSLVGAVGPGMDAKKERFKELSTRIRQLESKITEYRLEQHQITKELAQGGGDETR